MSTKPTDRDEFAKDREVCEKATPLDQDPEILAVAKRLSYDRDTGVLTWTAGPRKGRQAGALDSSGYIRIGFSKTKKIRGHQAAFLIMTGRIPELIDHINRTKSDNRWSNLREATHSENARNSGMWRNNKTGYKNVFWDAHRECYRVEFKFRGQYRAFGAFNSLERAACVAQIAREDMYANT